MHDKFCYFVFNILVSVLQSETYFITFSKGSCTDNRKFLPQ